MGETVYLEENREYAVITSVDKDNETYVYLVTTDEPYKVKFAKEIWNSDNLDLEIVHEKELKEELLQLFQNKLKQEEL